jgi:predicted transposase YbfD/YdcC
MDKFKEAFSGVKTLREYDGYWCKISDIILIATLGMFCGYKNPLQIHRWAGHERISEFLRRNFGICRVPCYDWFLELLGIIDPKSLNEHFERWVRSMIVESLSGLTVSFDGKTVRSTAKMDSYDNPLHIISAQIGELRITLAQIAVEDKSNEIPAVQSLLRMLDIKDATVVADALNCQKKTAEIIVEKGADYILNVKGNQSALEEDIRDYVQDSELRETMDTATIKDYDHGRIERRTAYVTDDIDWLYGKKDWENLSCVAAIHRYVETKNGVSNEWRHFITSKKYTAEELLKHVRLEWSVESMHWLLDVHYGEDYCRIENKNTQQVLNILRKIALNFMRNYKNRTASDVPFSHYMQDCQLDPDCIIKFLHI